MALKNMQLKKIKLTKYFMNGFSIIEMLISMTLLAVVMIIATQSLATSLRNSKKSDSISKTRENIEYSISTMERLLRNAQSAVCSADFKTLDYVDEYGNATSFSCNSTGGYIASGSGSLNKLTSADVQVICSPSGTVKPFQCPTTSAGVPDAVVITIRAQEARLGGTTEGSVVESKTKILLRNYEQF